MRLALLGDPVLHSRSPAIHEAALAACGIGGTYEARLSGPDEVREACEEIRAGLLDGANVTMPLKAVALAESDRASDPAGRVGAVNTLFGSLGSVVGDNTDISGINHAWLRRGVPDDAPVLVLGAGSAAAAALVAREGSPLFISSRRPGAGSALASVVGVAVVEIPWGRPVDGAVVVNATPLGMQGETLPAGLLKNAVGLLDMAYGPAVTPSVAEMVGRPVADGLDLLVAQAAGSFEIWTGRTAPIAVMESAARSPRTP